ncbi:RING-type domain-containing protein, partial [Durusdinium trenchii]
AAEAAACHARLRAATAGLPAAACVHLGWALRHLLAPGHSGYAPAAAQEVILQVFGGLAFAANLDRLTDSFRLAGPPGTALGDQGPTAVSCPPEASSPPATLRPGSWRFLDDVDLAAEFERPVRTMQSVPRFLAPGLRHAFLISLRALAAPRATPQQQCRAWKLFLLTPRLLLRPTAASGPAGRELLLQRLAAFEAGRWERLLDDARGPAPGTAATLAALSDPERRPQAPRSPVSPAVLDYQPQVPLPLSAHDLADALRTSKRGSAAGLSGATAEHYKVLLDDEDALELFARAATALANGA